jgi:hypothetical protein
MTTRIKVVIRSGCVEAVLANDKRLEVDVIDLDNLDNDEDSRAERRRLKRARKNPAWGEVWL